MSEHPAEDSKQKGELDFPESVQTSDEKEKLEVLAGLQKKGLFESDETKKATLPSEVNNDDFGSR